MKNLSKLFLFTIVLAIIFYGAFSFVNKNKTSREQIKIRSTSSPKASIKMKKARQEYFERMLRDPKTMTIPRGIRQKELAFAKKLNEENKSLNKTSSVNELDWKEAGPGNVGGRTRALAVDVTDPNIIIAGGASGGIWKSTDKGNTWAMKSTNTQLLSVSTLVQDPRPGHTNTWYYGTGEILGSPPDAVRTHTFSGNGIYKSIDNGETWSILSSTFSSNFTIWDSAFDYVDKIEISPTTGSMFVCNYGIGIVKSVDGGNTFTQLLGGTSEHEFSDISIADDGSIVVVMSSPIFSATPQKTPGVYKSSDDGKTWTNITPSTFPQTFSKSKIELAPSNKNIAYVFTYVKVDATAQAEDIRFHKINISNGTSEDRSANLPEFQFTIANSIERINTQRGYNITLAVKPDNENFVIIGATSLFRSTNGFSSKPSNAKMDWIGGYHPDYFQYPNFHSDIHSYCFEPNNPNAVWWGHDGGLSYTSDITNINYQDVFPWENKNNGYNVTQFFHMSIPREAGDNRIMGGTQDNGTPFFVSNGTIGNQIEDVSSGDGSYSYFSKNFAYTSSQDGVLHRIGYDTQNYPNYQASYSRISPTGASNQLFINPFAVDPSDEEIMYYPAGNLLWRNNKLSSIPNFQQGTTVGWTKLDNLSLPTGYIISGIAVSNSNPAYRLYYGGTDFSQQSTGSHKLFKIDNANNATNGAIDISISGLDPFSYINSIIINPENADELIVVFSNYNIIGVYHSIDAGQTFTPIEGNLVGDKNNPGPSVKSAAILPAKNGTQYFLATSIGVFSTLTLNGNNTTWTQEGVSTLGNVIVNSLATRKSDAKIVAGTHGRGAFLAYGEAIPNTAIANVDVNNLTLQSRPGQNGSTSFQLKNNGGTDLTYNISVTGSFGGNLAKSNSFKLEMSSPDKNSKEFNDFIKNSKFGKDQSYYTSINNSAPTRATNINGNDYLILDDGDSLADGFVGPGDQISDFDYYNEFNVSGFSYDLEAIDFFIRTEEAISNNLYAAIYNEKDSLLQFGYFVLDLSKDGKWYSAELNPKIAFNDGEKFKVELYSYSLINYPAGIDTDAQIPNNSYYFNPAEAKWVNINTQSGYENAAFLIRSKGTKSGGTGNQNPTAVANVSNTQVLMNETITFDGSQSSDIDGQITQYLWDFGDGSTSNQANVTHSYSEENTFNYSLTVTDNQGATGKATGQITVGTSGGNLVLVNPSSGTISSGGSETITLTLNAQNLSEGTYTGQVNITTNGGNITIPIDYLVDVEKLSSIPNEYQLSQNYPNPFNPTTVIEFSLPQTSNVSLKIYDALGREIKNLISDEKSAGSYKVSFDASTFSSGVYFYKLDTEIFSKIKKMLLIK